MSAPAKVTHISKIATVLIPIWLIAGIFGDELFALIYFRSVESAFEFSLGQPWWWVYQLIVGSIFALAWLVLHRIGPKSPIHSTAVSDTNTTRTG